MRVGDAKLGAFRNRRHDITECVKKVVRLQLFPLSRRRQQGSDDRKHDRYSGKYRAGSCIYQWFWNGSSRCGYCHNNWKYPCKYLLSLVFPEEKQMFFNQSEVLYSQEPGHVQSMFHWTSDGNFFRINECFYNRAEPDPCCIWKCTSCCDWNCI